LLFSTYLYFIFTYIAGHLVLYSTS